MSVKARSQRKSWLMRSNVLVTPITEKHEVAAVLTGPFLMPTR